MRIDVVFALAMALTLLFNWSSDGATKTDKKSFITERKHGRLSLTGER